MPTFQFEAMDATGAEIKDVIEAPTEEEAQATIRQMGYFVTKINGKTVLCFKSELHLNQDGIRSTVKPGTSTLPVKDMFNQIIDGLVKASRSVPAG